MEQLTAYLGSMKGSLTATISISSCSIALRNTIRPIRPKPLMPTLIAMLSAGDGQTESAKQKDADEAACKLGRGRTDS